MLAALPMYDWPQLRAATDALWDGLAAEMRRRGLDAPDRLERGRDPDDIWRDPALLFSQTCGYPYCMTLRGSVRLVAAPCYAVEGCRRATYRSAILVRADDPAGEPEALRGRRAAFNARHSQSGYSAFRAAFAPLARNGRFFGEASETGSHLASMEAVVAGAADCAAADAVAWALARAHRPDIADALRVLAWTAPAPALPFVTAARRRDDEVVAMRDALRAVLADPALGEACDALFLAGIEVAGDRAYDVIRDMERAAVEAGYPELA